MEVTGNKVVLNLTGADNMKHVEPNDFIIHLRSFQGGIEHSRYQGKVSNAYCVLIPNAKIEPRFFRWVLKSSGFIQELSSTTDQMRDGQSIKYEQFVSIGLPLPTLEEQVRLADYLDSRIATIDNVVELKKQQIASFKDFKTSLITSVVTGIYDEKTQGAK
jgi:type I restriction enzyme S subunit